MSAWTVILFVAGVGLLIGGAELLVRGASRLAAAAGISPLVIGLTVVAFGTGSPELAVSIRSAFAGQAEIAIGNVVGSNIMNVLVVLSLSALIAPLVVSQQLVRLDVPLMIGASLLMLLLSLDGSLGHIDGAILFSSIIAYTVWAIRKSRRESAAIKREYAAEFGVDPTAAPAPRAVQIGLVVAGLALLIIGAGWIIDGAVMFAQALGVSQLIIGLTIVAIGTSLPEIAISMLASWRGERDIAVGNVVGSNIFNLLGVLGLTALIAPNGISVPSSALNFDIIVMIITALACLPVFWVGYTIMRWEAAVFLIYYIVYTLYLLLSASQHDRLPMFSTAITLFILPITAITLMLRVIAERRSRRISRLAHDEAVE